MDFKQMDGLPLAQQLVDELHVNEMVAREILTIVMLIGTPQTNERVALLDHITYKIVVDAERWEDFRFQLLLDHLPKIMHRMILATGRIDD